MKLAQYFKIFLDIAWIIGMLYSIYVLFWLGFFEFILHNSLFFKDEKNIPFLSFVIPSILNIFLLL